MSLARALALVAAALVCARPAVAAPGAAGLDPARTGAIRAAMERFVAEGKIAGAVVAVGRRGRAPHLEAVGLADLANKTPMRADTMFRIASMSKLVTMTAVMMLEDEGKLDVAEPVERYLPEFRGLRQIGKRDGDTITLVDPPRLLTIQDLMTHTSGMACKRPPGLAELSQKRDRSLAEAVLAFSQHPLEYAPGVQWKYCETAFDTLGRLVEVASGQSFEAFLGARIFKPLGMKDTTYRPTPAQERRLAVVYRNGRAQTTPDASPGAPAAETQAASLVAAPRPGPMPMADARFVSPAGGLFSTAPDYARLCAMWLEGGQLRSSQRLLRAETVAKLATPVFKPSKAGEKVGFTPGLAMGLGAQVVVTPIEVTEALAPGSFGHGGAYGTQAWVDPANDAYYVLMIQRQGFGNGDMSEVRRAFQRAAADALLPATSPAAPASR